MARGKRPIKADEKANKGVKIPEVKNNAVQLDRDDQIKMIDAQHLYENRKLKMNLAEQSLKNQQLQLKLMQYNVDLAGRHLQDASDDYQVAQKNYLAENDRVLEKYKAEPGHRIDEHGYLNKP